MFLTRPHSRIGGILNHPMPFAAGDLLIPADHLIDDHSAVDATPGMHLRGGTGLYDEGIVNNCEPIASLAIHRSSSDRAPRSARGAACGISGEQHDSYAAHVLLAA